MEDTSESSSVEQRIDRLELMVREIHRFVLDSKPSGNALETPIVDSYQRLSQSFPDATSNGNSPNNQSIPTPTFPTSFKPSIRDESNIHRDSVLAAVSRGVPKTGVTLFRQPPPFEHKLERLAARDIMNFAVRIKKYERMHGASVEGPIFVKRTDMLVCIAKSRTLKSMQVETEEDFYELSNKSLFRVLQNAVRPIDSMSFAKVLSESVKFWLPDKFSYSIGTYNVFLTYVKIYIKDFSDMLEFLSLDNSANMPRIDNKENGIIRIFINKIPYEFGSTVFQIMNSTKFRTFEDFLVPFLATVEEQIKKSETIAEVEHFLKPMSNLLLRNIQESEISLLDTESGFTKADEVCHEDKSGEEEYPVYTEYNGKQIMEEDEDENFINNLNSTIVPKRLPPRIPATSPTKYGCLRKFKYGSCTNADCNYAHDSTSMEALLQEMIKAVREKRWINHGKVPELVSKSFAPKPPPQPPPRSWEEPMANYLNYIAPMVQLLSAVKTEATICLPSGKEIIATCLMDSGALSANYINLDYFEKIRREVKKVIKAHGSVKMANGQETRIKEMVELNLIFNKNGNYMVKETFIIVPNLGEEIIIGLPTIIHKLLSLFVAMLEKAAEEVTSSKLNMIIEKPWSVIEQEAIEDTEIPLPCSFTQGIHYLSITHDQAVKEYFDMLEGHVCKEFSDSTNIINLLKSSLGISVFVPTNWDGVKGLEPIEFNWKPGFPTSMKPKPRPVNPKLFENAKLEFERLLTYFYVPSDSPIASCLVIAPKTTKPFIRFCGDYATLVNKYICTGHYPIPHVFNSLEKIAKFKIFLDFDLANSFHQFRLGPITRKRLSLQTPWGQVEPIFLPEGVPPASGILQNYMSTIFNDFFTWTIVIFDNLLVLADSFDDAYFKCVKILEKCAEFNLVLKFSKTWLGFDKCEFFGYQCQYQSFSMTNERKAAINNIPMPCTLKGMQRFLGTSLFFRQFIPHFSELTARLHDMTKLGFNWTDVELVNTYIPYFENFKKSLLKSVSLFYPDYELAWHLRVDASDLGVAFVLLQVLEGVHQPILFGSHKFSDQAKKWDTYNKEAYAMVFGVKACEYYLRGKPFILEGDHRNLGWMEQSIVPKIIRWRIYLQGFSFTFNHIAGKQNIVADWQSRIFNIVSQAPQVPEKTELTQMAMLKQVHGHRSAHLGARRTWLLLNEHFPGHHIAYSQVADYIASCPVCQKIRLGMSDALVPIKRHLKVDGPRKVVGIDYLSLQKDDFGNTGAYVLRDHFSKLVSIYPTPNHTSESAASAIFTYSITFGVFDVLLSDPGSDFTSATISLLNTWFGIHHRLSLVDRHESNGVEGANKQILRHLKTLLCDERILHRWSSPSIIGWITYIMNTFDDSESGLSPYVLTFGSDSLRQFDFPKGDEVPKNIKNQYLQELNNDLLVVRTVASKFQQNLITRRTGLQNKQNLYQSGDLILLQHDTNRPLPSKLLPRYAGPFEVLKQVKNDIECRHLVQGGIKTFHVSRVKLFFGTREDAFNLAMVDADQHIIHTIRAYRGTPLRRQSMRFLVKFLDNEEIWLPWSEDLFQTVQYEEYCRSVPELFPLLYRARAAQTEISKLNSTPISKVSPGDVFFVDLRSYGYEWYENLDLPNADFITYVVRCVYLDWVREPFTLRARCDIFKELFQVDHFYVISYGSRANFDSTSMVLVDKEFLQRFPRINPSSKKT